MNRIFLLIFLFFLGSSFASQAKKELTLEDFVTSRKFLPLSPENIMPMNDGLHFTSLKNNSQIVRSSYKNGEEVNVVFDIKTIKDAPITEFSDYQFSRNEQRILLETNRKKIYRRSFSANYYIWDIQTKSLTPLSEKGAQQVVSFSPDGERVAFVRENNIFVKTIKFGTEQQVTTDGKTNEIINGIPDWVQEEEFGYIRAISWSPDSKMLAFLKFNETDVPLFTMPMYKGLEPELNENRLYNGFSSLKYPKAGENNSITTIHVFDLKTRTTIKVKTGDDVDVYFPRIEWNPSGNDLAIIKLNRRQNEADLLYANPHTGDIRTIIREKNNRYIEEDFYKQFQFLDDNEHFVVMSERDGWSQLYLYKNTGFFAKKITSGNFDVTQFYGYDKIKKVFFYQAAKSSPLQREVYSITLDGKKDELITPQKGTNDASFSIGFQYFINHYSNHATPPTFTIHDIKGKPIKVLENNSQLTDSLKNYSFPGFEFFSFKNNEDTELNGYMLKPSTFDKTKKYPVILTQYSGPNSQEVTDSWQLDWHSYLAEKGFIVVCVDPRGTAARGEEFRKSTYMQLGKLETIDLIDAGKYLSSLSFVDADKMGIWGWSYGGFTTLSCMAHAGNPFKAGVAVAPVTNWRFYDTVYTERFMRRPFENPDGYDENSPTNLAKAIKGRILLVHGTADENVHAQNSFEFAEALVQAGIDFDMHLYTNRNHSIRGGNTRLHLFQKIVRFFENELK
jgi:dipeptidyl-peptidase 4